MSNISYDHLRQERTSSFDDDDLELPELRPKSLDNYDETVYSIKHRGDAEDFSNDAYLLSRNKPEVYTKEDSMVAAVIGYN